MRDDLESWSAFVQACLNVRAEPRFSLLAGDASVRRFYRVLGLGRTAVLMVNPDPPKDEARGVDENETWVYLAGILREAGGCPPEVYGFDRQQGLILAEDLGDRLLQEEVLARGVGSGWTAAAYRRLLDTLALLQVEGGRRLDSSRIFNPRYDSTFMYQGEGMYFARQFAEGLCGWPGGSLDAELRSLAELAGAGAQRELLLYRDFQSRNVMLGPDGAFRLLDFQGARPGPPAYDTASLLYDPYVPLPESLRAELVEYFGAVLARLDPQAADEYRGQFPLIAVHRLMQVLGAYAKLGHQQGKREYLRYVPQALDDLRRMLTNEIFDPFRTLRRTVESLSPRVEGL